MKTLKSLPIIFIFFFLFTCSSYAQLKILLGPAIGMTSPTVDYSGETADYYMGTKYGLRPAFNFGAMGKVNLGPIDFNLSIIYSPMSNDGRSDPDPNHPNSTVEIKQKLLTIGIGTQYGISVPMSPVKPYIGFDILFSTISGSAKFQGTPDITSSEIDMETATRTGLGFNGGVEIKLFGTTVDASLRYNLINLFSKTYDGPSNSTTREDAYKYLNDAKDPNYSSSDPIHPVPSNRTIATIQIQLGVLFGL
jgi:hypothetical protein